MLTAKYERVLLHPMGLLPPFRGGHFVTTISRETCLPMNLPPPGTQMVFMDHLTGSPAIV